MQNIGFHASHELYPPTDLLSHVRRAEAAGFRGSMCSDHFHPWTPNQGQSAFSFAWLGAAMQATKLRMGTICCPIGRYHPAVVAQAAATLAVMFPKRFWLALGTGQALNEHITGAPWAPKAERQAAVLSAAAAVRALWAGEMVTLDGGPTIDRAQLFTRPVESPLLLGAATTPETARWVASWADGLLTANADVTQLSATVKAFRSHGGDNKPMYLQSMVGYDSNEERAWQTARDNWPIAVLNQEALQNTEMPHEFAEATKHVTVAELKGKGKIRISSDPLQHRDWIERDLQLGFDAVYLYTISGNPETFIDIFADKVLPHFH